MPAPRRRADLARSAFLALTTILALLHLGCATVPATAPRSELRIADEDLDRDPRQVSAAEALLDLERSVTIFEEAYAGLDGVPRTPAPSALSAARARIRAEARWEPAELARLLREVFWAPDGHLAFGYGGRAPLRLPAAPAMQRVSTLGAPRPAQAVSLERRGEVPVLAIRTFDSAAAEALEGLPAIAAELRREPAFVVDLRGNGGGNYRYAERFLLALTNETVRRLDEREVLSAAAAEGRANSARRRLRRGDVPEGAAPRFVEHIAALTALAADLRARGAGREDVVTPGGTARGTAPGPLRARAVFLVDGGCASACEMLLALARQLPAVTVAGQATRGGMAVGEVALFRLPRSGILVSLGTRAFRDPLGEFEETRGFAPDVVIEGPDPVAEAAVLARGGFDLAGEPRILPLASHDPSEIIPTRSPGCARGPREPFLPCGGAPLPR